MGGTFTDRVLVSGENVLAKAKAFTLEDVTGEVVAVLDKILEESAISSTKIGMVSFWTTHMANAIIERRNLNKVGIFRLGSPATTVIPPLTGWPDDLKKALGEMENVYIIRGGSGCSLGKILFLWMNEKAIVSACKEIKGKIDSAAMSRLLFLIVLHRFQFWTGEFDNSLCCGDSLSIKI